MKTSAVFSAVLSFVTFASTSSAASSSHTDLPSTFTPPQVFKNANLVHVISLEKNYVKENINVVIENIDKAPQQDYFQPFTADQISRLGGVEVKDRKDASVGPFGAEVVVVDSKSDLQYLRIRLPTPLKPSAQQTIGITFHFLKAYNPLPASIKQEDTQFLSYSFSAYCPSAYTTSKQKTEVKFPSATVPDFTKLPGSGEVKEFPQKQGSKLTYGPFDEKPAGALEPVQVRFEFNKPVTHVARLERDVEVSHWGGNVAFEERYTIFHRGANLSSLFNRVKWAQSQYYQPATHALKEIKFPLRIGSADPYYTDVIGNVSTSRFRSNKREALLEIKPRYPLFGGWKYPFTIGWNSDAKNFLRTHSGNAYILNVPFLEGPKQPEGVEYEQVEVRVILPEGAENVKYSTTIPVSSITDADVVTHKTFLDTIGRTALVIKARNLVDDFRERELVVSYEVPLLASLRKPLIIFGSAVALFVTTYILGSLDFRFSSK
ncbi:Ribophorin I [Lasiosphaeria miniovina]|uniref:Dolichyl-diphosphooligosaccharide--protein glycosyltransferase subunit 1 n=1 Tax=Lasiosphaeria miniovina TaxID=1954250 RepID=A0AA40BGT2_9PEZI|nr:Ribophorin I [Lasiosphaeria miniovina]KAK0733959.1 Ribophorin I [Lasiosphaeria miniovina]